MEIVMPKMGESINEGTILKWHKKKGDSVKRDEIIFEISTDKVDTEIPSPVEGILSEIKFNEGDTVAVGTVVAVVDSKEGADTKPEPVKETPAAIDETKIKPADVAEEKKNEIKQETIASDSPVKVEKNNVSSNGGIIEITMPKMGESVMEGTIIKWHKKAGDTIKKDETFFEISTDKVDTEVPSPEDGIVAEILIGEQETVEVGTVVAKLSVGKSTAADSIKEESAQLISDKISNEPKVIVDKKSIPESKPEIAAETKAIDETKNKSKFLSPLVMNIARKENISFDDIDKIPGTGIEGRVTKKDILNFVEERKSSASPAIKKEIVKETFAERIQEPESTKYEPSYSSSEVERIPMDNIRQKIMQHMVNSRDTSVHVSAMLEVDMSRIYNFIQKNRDEYLKKENIKLTYMPFIASACVKALKEFPLVNSSIEGQTIIKKKFINLGIAVAVEPRGLIVPNIKNADDKSIIGLAKSIGDIAARSRSKKLTPDDITNGTFTITNYGVFGTIFGTPIINQPEVAILGVGTVVKRPVVIEVEGTDTIAIKPVMALTLSHDHRLVDGMLGGKFLKYLKDVLESFNESYI